MFSMFKPSLLYCSWLISLPLLTLSTIPIGGHPAIAQLQPQDCIPGLPNCQPRNTTCHPEIIECPDRGNRFNWREQAIPYGVSPRRSKVLKPRLLLRWLPVPNATQYTVTLQGEGLAWQVQTHDTQIRYTGESALQPGGEYELAIEADTGESSWDEPSHLGGVTFQMLTDAERDAFENALQAQQANPSTQPLDIANFYLIHGLIAEGITQLEALHQEQPTATLAIQLGNLYFEWLLLPTVAEDYYQQALAIAEPRLTPLEEAQVLTQLGHAQAVMHDSAAAIQYWLQAQVIYQMLGNLKEVEALEPMVADENM